MPKKAAKPKQKQKRKVSEKGDKRSVDSLGPLHMRKSSLKSS